MENYHGYSSMADTFYQSFGDIRQINRMTNGDLQIDFRDAEVADTVCTIYWCHIYTVIHFLITFTGLPRTRKSIYCRRWQRAIILDSWQAVNWCYKPLNTPFAQVRFRL